VQINFGDFLEGGKTNPLPCTAFGMQALQLPISVARLFYNFEIPTELQGIRYVHIDLWRIKRALERSF
jgi:hypothetical protein